MNFTEKEAKIITYISSKKDIVYWEELAQFSKEPGNVKLRTVQKAVSEIKRKCIQNNLNFPFTGKFGYLNTPQSVLTEQKLVQVKRTPDGNTVVVSANKPAAQIDYILDRNTKSIRTKYGSQKLNDDEWQMICYFDANIGRIIKISELRDRVKFPNYGSKLPQRWFDSIMRTINGLRRSIPNMRNRILTTKVDNETSYLYQ